MLDVEAKNELLVTKGEHDDVRKATAGARKHKRQEDAMTFHDDERPRRKSADTEALTNETEHERKKNSQAL